LGIKDTKESRLKMKRRKMTIAKFRECKNLYNQLQSDELKWLEGWRDEDRMLYGYVALNKYHIVEGLLKNFFAWKLLVLLAIFTAVLGGSLPFLHAQPSINAKLSIFLALTSISILVCRTFSKKWDTLVEGWLDSTWDDVDFFFEVCDLASHVSGGNEIFNFKSDLRVLKSSGLDRAEAKPAPSGVVKILDETLLTLVGEIRYLGAIVCRHPNDRDPEKYSQMQNKAKSMLALMKRVRIVSPQVELSQYHGRVESEQAKAKAAAAQASAAKPDPAKV
jgi:hypothetical protein